MTYYTTNSVPPYIPDQNQDGELPGVNEPYLEWVASFSARSGFESLISFIDYLLGLDHPPTVITTSYGDDEQTVISLVLMTTLTLIRPSITGPPSTLSLLVVSTAFAHMQPRTMPTRCVGDSQNSGPGSWSHLILLIATSSLSTEVFLFYLVLETKVWAPTISQYVFPALRTTSSSLFLADMYCQYRK
jgi:hypothetical protein